MILGLGLASMSGSAGLGSAPPSHARPLLAADPTPTVFNLVFLSLGDCGPASIRRMLQEMNGIPRVVRDADRQDD